MGKILTKKTLTSTDLANITGDKSDLIYNITTDELVVLDGNTVGGIPLAKKSHTHSSASQSIPGFMSPSDKTKLDGLTGSTLPPGSSANNPTTTVIRDGSGNFAANAIDAVVFNGPVNGAASSISGNLTGDITSVGMATSLATVNTNIGTFGDSTHVAQVTLDSKGRVTNATSVVITGAAPTGAAGGDLVGNFPSPTLAVVNSTPGTFGNSNQVAQVAVDAKGRITAVSNVTITGASPTGIAGGDLTGNFPNPTVATVGSKAAAVISTSVDATLAATGSATINTLAKRDGSGKMLLGLTQVGDPAATAVTKSYVDALSGGGSGSKNFSAYRVSGGVQQVANNSAIFSSTGASTFVVPSNVSVVYLVIIGGGAGAGGGSFAETGFAGGGSGGVFAGFVGVSPGSSLGVTVGQGGAGGPTEKVRP